MCFVWISEQTAIISIYSINWLVFITVTESVYCAVRTECLYIIQVNFCFCWPFRRLVAKLLLRRLVFEPRWDLRWTNCHWDGFFWEYFGFALSLHVSFHQNSVNILIYTFPFLEV